MSLRIWLSFDGNLDNKGLDNLNITPVGETTLTYSNGKIGQQGIYYNNNGYLLINNVNLGENVSMAYWLKTANVNSQMVWILNNENNQQINFFSRNDGYCYLNTGDSNKNPFQTDTGVKIQRIIDDQWHHYIIIFNSVS